MLNHFPKIYKRTFSSLVEGLRVSRRKDKAIIEFNRPEKLNAQTIEMQVGLAKYLRNFESDSSVAAVIIKGNGTGFSAGADVVQFCRLLETDESRKIFGDNGVIFYRELLRLCEYKKPVISLADGVCLGGGAAVAFMSSHPVTTERTAFAMPEVFIGLYANMGSNHFAANLPNNVGMWLGLTGKRFIGPDIVKIGLSKNYVKSDDINELEDALVSLENSDNESVSKTIAKFHSNPDFSKWNVDLNKIDKLFAGSSVEEIVDTLKKDNSELSANILKLLSTLSPTSLKITFNLYRQSQLRRYDPNDALSADFSFSKNFYFESDANRNDFREGVRSILIDKKHKPNWIPKSLDEVDDNKVISYFTNNVINIRLSDP